LSNLNLSNNFFSQILIFYFVQFHQFVILTFWQFNKKMHGNLKDSNNFNIFKYNNIIHKLMGLVLTTIIPWKILWILVRLLDY
jgi:hypothetical protein